MKIIKSGLLGQKVVELFFRDEAVLVEVGSLDHLLEHIVVGQLSQILGDFPQVLQGNVTGPGQIESHKDLVNFFSGLILGWPGGHHGEEFVELQLSAAVLIDFSNHVPDSFGLSFNTEGIDAFLEF